MRALAIAWKDTRHLYRNAAALAMMLAAPLLLATVLGAAFGGGGNFSLPPVKTLVVDLDRGSDTASPAAGAILTAMLTSPDLADVLAIERVDTPEAARAMVDGGDADVAVIIPAGLSDALAARGSSGRGGTAAEVQIYRDPALSVGPAVVTAVLQSGVQAINGAQAAGAASAELTASLALTDPAGLAQVAKEGALAFSRAASAERPVALTSRAPSTTGQSREDPNVASQVLLGMMIFFMLFGASNQARSIIDEHRQGTLSRLFATPSPRGVILGGKYISVFSAVLIQSAILLLAGRLFYGAHWGPIGPVIALTLGGALVAAALALLMVSIAKTPAQAGAVSSAVFVFLALIGGNFIGTVDVGGTLALIRRFTPNGWLLEGWDGLLFGGSWSSIAWPMVATLAFSAVFFAFATILFRRRYA